MEKPILFNAQMVRAIVDGTKTQTRRVISVQPDFTDARFSTIVSSTDRKDKNKPYRFVQLDTPYSVSKSTPTFKCPYGEVGDQLWVREAFSEWDDGFVYRATYPELNGVTKWKPSIHMPRCASRIDLKITSIRVERLHDISKEDVVAEGIQVRKVTDFWGQEYDGYSLADEWKKADDGLWKPYEISFCGAINAWGNLWIKVNGDESWNSNPWVWVVEFERTK